MDQVIQYILQEYHRGVHPEQIKSVLYKQGFTQAMVENYFVQAFNTYGVQGIDQRLSSYIQSQMQQGFNRKDIESALINSGYSESEISNSFNSLSPSGFARSRIALPSKKSIIAILVLTIGIIALALSIYFVLLQGDDDSKGENSIIVTLSNEPERASAGEVLAFSMNVRTKEPKSRLRGTIDTKVYFEEGFEILTSNVQPASLGLNDVQVVIPGETITGRYQVVSAFRSVGLAQPQSFWIDVEGQAPTLTQSNHSSTDEDEEEIYIDYYDPQAPIFGDYESEDVVMMS